MSIHISPRETPILRSIGTLRLSKHTSHNLVRQFVTVKLPSPHIQESLIDIFDDDMNI